jgi:hypothetical protein
MPKIKLADGSIIQHGQMSRPPAPKRTQVKFAPAPGMHRVSTGDMHPYLHGQTRDDSVPEKTYTRGAPPLHPFMKNPDPLDVKSIGRASLVEGSGHAVLEDANNFGKRQPQ